MKNENIVVIGLGYVGLTLATALANAGYRVLGIEKRQEIVDLTNKGTPHFVETGLKDSLLNAIQNNKLKAFTEIPNNEFCGIYIITVGTPLNQDGKINLRMIKSATKQVAFHMKDESLVILRSTVKIGTTRNIVKPILKATKKKFYIAMCPERTLEGQAMKELKQLPQIIGADDQVTHELTARLFRKLTNTTVAVSSLETAEMIKLVDNTYRDVQFGFANEIARACEAISVNASEVITMGKLGYARTNIPMPGLVGGPCLEKDPHILYQSVLEKGKKLEITYFARIINERQPKETIKFIYEEANKRKMDKKIIIAILGMAFKGIPETDDLRGSMSIKVFDELIKKFPRASINIYDPVISPKKLQQEFTTGIVQDDLLAAINQASIVLICNNHPSFGGLNSTIFKNLMKKNGFIYDYWNNYSNYSSKEFDYKYYATGNLKNQ